jgi:hypothetical protein
MKYRILSFVAASFFFSGCAGSLSTAVPNNKIAYSEQPENTYIVFSRPSLLGAALSNTIIEFDPKTNDTQYVGTLGAKTRVAYQTTPGTHYFYMAGGENDDMIKVTTKSSTEYYVHTQPQIGLVAGRFYFKPIRYQSVKTAKALNHAACDKTILNQYQFKEVRDDSSDLLGVKKYHSSKHSIDIECKKGTVTKSRYAGVTFEDLSETPLIQPNQEGYAYYREHLPNYLKEIKEDFSDWYRKDSAQTALLPNDGKPLGK